MATGNRIVRRMDQIDGISATQSAITNPGAESRVAPAVAYADAAASTPVDGTGGSPTVTITRTTSSPIAGSASYLITKDAANRQGEGVSWDFSINSGDQTKVHRISFDYVPGSGFASSSGAVGSDSDIGIYVYDVTNAVLVAVSPKQLTTGATFQGTYVGEFQASSNSTSYRLILHVQTTSTTAWTFKLDNLDISRRSVVHGVIVEEEITTKYIFVPSASAFPSVSNETYRAYRNGKYLEVEGIFRMVTTAAATAQIAMPAGLVIDGTNLPTGSRARLGYFNNLEDSATPVKVFAEGPDGAVFYDGSDANTLFLAYRTASESFKKDNASAFLDATNRLSFHAKIPILGWSSNTELSSEADTRTVAARMYASATTGSIAPDSFTKITLNTAVYDTHGAFNSASSYWKAPVSGKYHFIFHSRWSSNNLGDRVIGYDIDEAASPTLLTLQPTGQSDSPRHEAVIDLDLRAGQTVAMWVYHTGTGGNLSTTGTTANDNWMAVHKIGGASTIAASEQIAVSVIGNVPSTSANTPFIYPTVSYDTHGIYNTSTGEFKIPRPGYAILSGFTNSSDPANGIRVYVNGSPVKYIGQLDSNGEGTQSGQIKVAANDIVTIRPDGTVDPDAESNFSLFMA